MFKKIILCCGILSGTAIMHADESLATHGHPNVRSIAQNKGRDLQEEPNAQNSADSRVIELIDCVAPILGFINGYAWKYVQTGAEQVLILYVAGTLVAVLGIPFAVSASKPSPEITDDLTLRAMRKIQSDQNKEQSRQFLLYSAFAAAGAFVQSLVP